MTLETRPLLVTDLAPTAADQAELLSALLCDEEDGSTDLPAFLIQLGKLARERGMTDAAKAAGVSRTRLYHSLSGDADPRIGTVAAVLETLGFALAIVPRRAPQATQTTKAAAE